MTKWKREILENFREGNREVKRKREVDKGIVKISLFWGNSI